MADASGFGGIAQPRSTADVIWQQQTAGYNDVLKTTILALLPADTLEIIPFTQREYDAVFKYKAESERPMLDHTLLLLRHGHLETAGREELWQPIYAALLERLPENIASWLDEQMSLPFNERDPDFVVLHNVLTYTARAIGWLSAVAQPRDANDIRETLNIINQALPFIAMRGSIAQAETILDTGTLWLNSVGPNHPDYDTLSGILTQTRTTLNELNTLRQEVEKGNNSPEVQQRLVEVAHTFERIRAELQASGTGNDLQILNASLEGLSLISSAWALNFGSPSLLIATTIASIGLSATDSEAGLFGEGLNTVLDSVAEALLSAFAFGPRAEIAELEELYKQVAALRDGQGGLD